MIGVDMSSSFWWARLELYLSCFNYVGGKETVENFGESRRASRKREKKGKSRKCVGENLRRWLLCVSCEFTYGYPYAKV